MNFETSQTPADNAAEPQAGGVRREEWERRQDSEPAIVPSVLFDEQTVNSVNWESIYGF